VLYVIAGLHVGRELVGEGKHEALQVQNA